MNKIKILVLMFCASGILLGCQKSEESVTNVRQATTVTSETTKTAPSVKNSVETATLFTTAKDTDLRLTNTGKVDFKKGSQPTENEISVFVNPQIHFQTMLGFGGAVTDASAEVFAKLSATKQDEFLEAYYGDEGLEYSLARTTIHSTDFSSESYTYIDEGDAKLDSFSIEHDREFRIPLIKRAIETAGGELLMYASPWSPPAFMKDSNNMLQGGQVITRVLPILGQLLHQVYQSLRKRGHSYLGYYHPERTHGDTDLGIIYLQCRGGA